MKFNDHVRKEDLYPGCLVFYRPDIDSMDTGTHLSELPWGSLGMYICIGKHWDQFVTGCEPASVLFGCMEKVITVYLDELTLF